MSDVYFEGDPATDSARRHMERVLKSPEPPPRWPWLLAVLGSGGLWMMWRWGRASEQAKGVPQQAKPQRTEPPPRPGRSAPEAEAEQRTDSASTTVSK